MIRYKPEDEEARFDGTTTTNPLQQPGVIGEMVSTRKRVCHALGGYPFGIVRRNRSSSSSTTTTIIHPNNQGAQFRTV